MIDEVDYCNNRLPRKQTEGYPMKLKFSYTGNITKRYPEGFSATITSLPPERYKGPVVVLIGKLRKHMP